MSEAEKFESWAIVEVMGHARFAGFVTEQAVADGSFVRVDVPAIGDKPAFTKFFGAKAIYSISPCTEEASRKAASLFRSKPVDVWGIEPVAQIAGPDGETGHSNDEDFDDDEDE